VSPRAGLDTEARGKIFLSLPGIEHRSPFRPVRGQTELPRLPIPNSRKRQPNNVDCDVKQRGRPSSEMLPEEEPGLFRHESATKNFTGLW
jgi:hypothetical protein